MSDEEKKAIQYLNKYCDTDLLYEQRHYNYIKMIIRLVGKQSKEIEEYKKQLDLDNECEIALNSKVMDLEKEIEELKEDRKSYAEEYIHNNPWLYKQLNENYILRVEAEALCNKKWEDKIKAKIEELDLAIFKNQTIYTVNKMQEIKFARLCLAELLEKE